MKKTQNKQKHQTEQTQIRRKNNRTKLTEVSSVNAEHDKLISWFQTVRFRKKMFGGIDEEDLWRKLEELNRLYESALIAERARYDALLQTQQRQEVEQ